MKNAMITALVSVMMGVATASAEPAMKDLFGAAANLTVPLLKVPEIPAPVMVISKIVSHDTNLAIAKTLLREIYTSNNVVYRRDTARRLRDMAQRNRSDKELQQVIVQGLLAELSNSNYAVYSLYLVRYVADIASGTQDVSLKKLAVSGIMRDLRHIASVHYSLRCINVIVRIAKNSSADVKAMTINLLLIELTNNNVAEYSQFIQNKIDELNN
ncbi:MAG: hypothetical protein A2X34_03750 [Elusimicrobia bacterium GWC2_51_8]|nr:MAG: hypothetical protein A2X33_11090 [Elusimicrobia bacterium GWA2_51_34]OGR60375.1 MAG: hypothetical protein A2X34_03750 [Elusimicrobia bacterium GWC2_51_8]OGR86843.1 MAG: hypothetical protein A2021_04170 [Elusimicrobia bacterium GWF2_52_66]HAF95139.1 hypothetical protein [Elusimicrobiota bacterium]HCE99007.1 hypothetical protein [Elusimicrobiota bacterium]